LALELVLGRGGSGSFLQSAQVPVAVASAGLGSKMSNVKEAAIPYKLGGPRFFGW
jgi:hypothetical protein